MKACGCRYVVREERREISEKSEGEKEEECKMENGKEIEKRGLE
jgi:hypothetical protein